MKRKISIYSFLFLVILNNTIASGISFINRGTNTDYGFVKKKKDKIDKIKVINKSSNETNLDIRNEIINFATKKLGSPYLWGASGTDKFDCSSFVQYVYKQTMGINLPRVSYEQAQFKPRISKIRKGDLLFFETLGKGRISHVGIYMGDNRFIHASSASKKVVISEFSGFYREKFKWAISVI
ncbi:peptidoglycan endopeptidase [Leptotrichia sp. OH3620_COT-345]|uniref:C40 family peptidase n=1 Tax=Leptotrichia sp. OH3620_COT-345 TaxID=2491048 RepID=UPI000F64D2F1|nr:C40 family peptidase [Leptotrichia sp. OH3620_COT-345]RRD40350.1 peptidoglycan endopeptidase [Leptotrichia sp. OH3620_COT-345]